jgi:hypothetical protein
VIGKPYCFSPANSRGVVLYYGIEVEVLTKMDHCSLIRYGDLKVIVETEDLVYCQAKRAAA